MDTKDQELWQQKDILKQLDREIKEWKDKIAVRQKELELVKKRTHEIDQQMMGEVEWHVDIPNNPRCFNDPVIDTPVEHIKYMRKIGYVGKIVVHLKE
jgi:predicted  nucleic acid-binding Zn-ribbon protein